MIKGIGVDTATIERIEKACKKQSFIDKCYSQDEQVLINFEKNNKRTYERATGNFAVKEAVMKAFGTGMNGIEFYDISVLRKDSGAPFVVLSNTAKAMADSLGVLNIFVSITNTDSEATAFVVLEG